LHLGREVAKKAKTSDRGPKPVGKGGQGKSKTFAVVFQKTRRDASPHKDGKPKLRKKKKGPRKEGRKGREAKKRNSNQFQNITQKGEGWKEERSRKQNGSKFGDQGPR